MGFNQSLIARLGLDTADFKKGLQDAGQAARAAHGTMADATKRNSEAQEHLLASSHRVAGQIGQFSKNLIAGGNAADIFSAGLEGVEKSLHLSLGTLAGLSIGAVLVEGIFKAKEEAQKLHEEIERLTSTGGGSAQFETLSALNAQLDEAKKKLEELSKLEGPGVSAHKILEFIGTSHLLGGDGYDEVLARNSEDMKRLQDSRAQANEGIAAKEGQSTHVASLRLNQGDFAADRQAALDTFKEKYNSTLDEKNNGALGDQFSEQYTLTLEGIKKKEEAQNRAIALEEKLTTIKREGQDVALKGAQAQVDAAQKEFDLANSEGKGAASVKLEAAKDALTLAHKQTEELRQQQDLTGKIANARVDPDRKRSMQIEGERANLQAQFDKAPAGSDERRRLQVELDKNAADGRAQEDAMREKGHQTEGLNIDATTGRGAAEQIEAVRRKLELAESKQGDIAMRPDEHTDEERAAAAAAVNGLRNQYNDLTESRDKLNHEAEVGTQIAQAELDKNHDVAEVLRIKLDYEERIAQAKKDGNEKLATELQNQRQIALNQRDQDQAKLARDAASETAMMDAQSAGHLSLATRLQIELQYRDKINAALADGNTELANQLQKQQQIALNEQAVNQALKTPQQKQQEADAERARTRAKRVIDKRADDKADHDARDPESAAREKNAKLAREAGFTGDPETWGKDKKIIQAPTVRKDQIMAGINRPASGSDSDLASAFKPTESFLKAIQAALEGKFVNQ